LGLDSWLEAQKREEGYWDSVRKEGYVVTKESMYRFSRLLSLLYESNFLERTSQENLLDVGCGPHEGIFAMLHADESTKVGVDALARLYKGKSSRKIEPITGTAERLPLRNNAFNIVFCVNALDHTSDPQMAVDELYRVTEVGGVLSLMVHVVGLKKKAIFQLFHSYWFVKKVLLPLRYDRKIKLIFRMILKMLSIFYREDVYDIFVDGYLHPHYITLPEIIQMLRSAGYYLIHMAVMEDPWVNKLGTYFVLVKGT